MYSGDDNDPFMMVFLAIILLFFIYYTLYSLYDLWCIHRSRIHHIRSSRSRSRLSHRPAMYFVPVNPSHHIAPRGLDPAVLKSLPLFIFSDVTHKDPIDCAVCLSEFEEGEPGRVLPGCEHAFHVECIDMWFHSHSTCPLCRSLVEPLAETVTIVEEQTVIEISPEPVSATEPVTNSGSTSAEMSRRSFSESENNLTRNVRANRSFTLPPMSRMLSFTRMLSRERRSAPSSFAGAPPQSPPSSSCRIVDIERGGEEIKSDFRHVDIVH